MKATNWDLFYLFSPQATSPWRVQYA